jgi:hypothetical protein
MQRRIMWLESALPKVEPHEKIRPLIAGYAVRVRAIADQLEAIADDGPVVPAGELCVGHGARRGPDGNCVRCRRPDVPRLR